MKNLNILFTIACLLFSTLMNAQQIEHEGKEYQIKGDIILLDGVDVTNSFTKQQQTTIQNKLKNKLALDKKIKNAEKAQKKAVSKQKKAEKKQKQAEKNLKKREKIQNNYEISKKKYKQSLKKYEKLKDKGKLSLEDEAKWLNKIEKLKESIKKNEKRLNRL